MESRELWEKACWLMKEDMNEVSYNTWIQASIRPRTLTADTLYLELVTDFIKKTVVSRYEMLITNAVTQAAGHALQVVFGTASELDQLMPNEQSDYQHTPLNPKYTFDTFVVGNSNRFAHAASLAVAEVPAEAYNPLFIYGGVGLGKTHLMHAIGHYVQHQYASQRLLYISSENFTNELIQAITRNKNVEFRNRFRNVDVLMVDDIQFIAGRDSTQEEFFHTFNALHTAGKQIIISSDKPPKEIPGLEERLVSRFEWGLSAGVEKPDIETRIAILRRKASSEHIQVEDEVLELIASRVDSNIRELEGSLTRLTAFASLSGRAINMELAGEALHDILTVRDPKRITCEMIRRAVAEDYRVEASDLTSKKRNREIAVPRQVAMFLTREMTEMSLPRIGAAFDRDHSTVLHACDKIALDAQADASFAARLEALRKAIREV